MRRPLPLTLASSELARARTPEGVTAAASTALGTTQTIRSPDGTAVIRLRHAVCHNVRLLREPQRSQRLLQCEQRIWQTLRICGLQLLHHTRDALADARAPLLSTQRVEHGSPHPNPLHPQLLTPLNVLRPVECLLACDELAARQ